MEHERTSWNDDRIDRLADGVADLSAHVDGQVTDLRNHVDRQVTDLRNHVDRQVTDLRNHFDDRFDALGARLEKRFDTLTYGMIYSLASILAAFGGALFALNA